MKELTLLPVSSNWTSLRLAMVTIALGLSGCAQMQQQMQQPGYYNIPSASSTTDAISQAEGAYATQGIRAPNQIQFDLRQQQANTNTNSTRAAATPPVAGTASGYGSPVATATPVKAPDQSGNTPAQAVQTKPYDAAGAPIDTPPADLTNQQNAAATDATAASTPDSLRTSLVPEAQTFSGTLPCFHPEMKCTAQRITLSLAPNGRWRARAAYLEQNSQSGANQADQGCWRVTPMNPPRIVLLNAQGGVRAEMSLASGSNALRLISINADSPNLTYTLTRQPDLDPIDELNKKPAPNCP
jgi:hypothetical protein